MSEQVPYTSERVDPSNYQSTEEDRLILIAHEQTYLFVSQFVKGKTVLDLGCGEGYGANLLSKFALKVTGADVSSEVVKRARAKYVSETLNFEILPAVTGSKLPFPDSSFDVVVCFHVIEHVRSARALVREIRRVLRPRGLLFLSTPNADVRLLAFQNPWNRYHVEEFTKDSLRDLIRTEFREIRMMGITLRQPWLRFEKQRSKRYAIVLWPITNKLIPGFARRFLLSAAATLGSFLKKTNRNPGSASPAPDDVQITSETVESSPSLFIIAGDGRAILR